MTEQSELETGDYLVLVCYFAIVIGTGVFSSLKNRGSIGGYFLAGQNASWWLVGLSLFASNIGSGHFIGLAGTAAKNGIAISTFELYAVFTLFMLGWLFVPVYRATGIFTLPEYLCKRFGGVRIRMYLAIMSLLLYVSTKISADLFSGALFLNQAIHGVGIYLSVVILISISALFTITGGLTAVIWTDAVQTFIMIIGAFVLMGVSFYEVGGYAKVKSEFPNAMAQTWKNNLNNSTYEYVNCTTIDKDYYFRLMHPADAKDLPWTGVVFGLTVSAVWYWCTDQVIVQRTLAAKNMVHAKAACILASYLKILPLYLIVLPGMIARILYPDEIACNEPEKCQQACENENGCTDIAYPKLVMKLMPVGLRGLILSVMMSALISSLTSVFNSTATIFVMDVWCHIRKQASDVELMIVGRMCVVALVVISVSWLPIVRESRELFHYIQAFTSFLAPPVCAIFLLAVFWKRTTEPAAFWGLVLGLVVGLVRGCWEMYYLAKQVPCGKKGVEKHILIAKVHYLHFGALLFLMVGILGIIVSFLTPKPPAESYMGMTFQTRHVKPSAIAPSGVVKTQSRPGKGANRHPQYFNDMLVGRTFDEMPCHTKTCLWICGVEDMARPGQEMQVVEMDRSIYEEPKYTLMLLVQMIMTVCVIIGMWTFYSI